MDVVGRRLVAHENCLEAVLFPRHGIVGRKDRLAGGRAGRSVKALADDLDRFVGIDARVEELIERRSGHHGNGAAFV